MIRLLRCLPIIACALSLPLPRAHGDEDFFLREPQPPVIPKTTFSIRDFGAQGDGQTNNTAAIQAALDACGKAHGGAVVVPEGVFITGPLHLASHTALVLEKGAVLQASGQFSDFGLPAPLPTTQPEIDACKSRLQPLIGGSGLEDVAILGPGTIDGGGAPWWAKSDRTAERARPPAAVPGDPAVAFVKPLYVPRPHLIVFGDCTRVLLRGVTLANSPMFHFVPRRCREVLVDGVTIRAPADAPNTDGIDPANSQNVLIRRCTIDTGDDNIALKAGSGGRLPTEDVTVTDCTFLHGHGVSIGSEVETGVRRFLVQRCTFENTVTALRIKSDRSRGGVVQQILYRDIKMKNVDEAIQISLYYDNKKGAAAPEIKPVTPETPLLRYIHFVNITCDGVRKAGEILGLPESPVSGIMLENVHITGAASGFLEQDARGVRFIDVDVQTAPAQPPIESAK